MGRYRKYKRARSIGVLTTAMHSTPFSRNWAVHRRLDGEMTPAEGTMQASKEADEQRLLAAKVVYGYLPLVVDRIKDNARRSIAGL